VQRFYTIFDRSENRVGLAHARSAAASYMGGSERQGIQDEINNAEAGHFEQEAEALAKSMVADAERAFEVGTMEEPPLTTTIVVTSEEEEGAPDKYEVAPVGAKRASIRKKDLWTREQERL
jgi:hypothetical protein